MPDVWSEAVFFSSVDKAAISPSRGRFRSFVAPDGGSWVPRIPLLPASFERHGVDFDSALPPLAERTSYDTALDSSGNEALALNIGRLTRRYGEEMPRDPWRARLRPWISLVGVRTSPARAESRPATLPFGSTRIVSSNPSSVRSPSPRHATSDGTLAKKSCTSIVAAGVRPADRDRQFARAPWRKRESSCAVVPD